MWDGLREQTDGILMEKPKEERTGALTRKQIQQIKARLRYFIVHEDYEGFKGALVSDLGIPLASDRFRFLESEFWRQVAAWRNAEKQKP